MLTRDRTKGRQENGYFIMLRNDLIRHEKFAALSAHATKLFVDLCAQVNGQQKFPKGNNGDLSCSWKVMHRRGWKSRATLDKARDELERSGFIFRTRQGGRNKCNLFALTCFPIDDCRGKLDVESSPIASNKWKQN